MLMSLIDIFQIKIENSTFYKYLWDQKQKKLVKFFVSWQWMCIQNENQKFNKEIIIIKKKIGVTSWNFFNPPTNFWHLVIFFFVNCLWLSKFRETEKFCLEIIFLHVNFKRKKKLKNSEWFQYWLKLIDCIYLLFPVECLIKTLNPHLYRFSSLPMILQLSILRKTNFCWLIRLLYQLFNRSNYLLVI